MNGRDLCPGGDRGYVPHTRVVGIDPGPNPGLVVLTIRRRALSRAATFDLDQLDDVLRDADLVSMERFIIGRGTTRRTRGGTDTTLAMIGDITGRCDRAGVAVVSFPAGMVKPWASNDRLAAWGITLRGDHHRDAARHALFAAVRAGLLPRRPGA